MIYTREVLETRLKWVTAGRLAVTILLIGVMMFLESLSPVRGTPGGEVDVRYFPAYWTLISVCGLNLVYLFLIRLAANLRILAGVQLALDVVIVSLLVYFTGIDRLFAFFYFAIVLIAPHLLRPALAFVFASSASIMLAAVTVLHYLASGEGAGASLPLVDPVIIQEQALKLSFLLPYLASFAVSLHVTALLSFVLAKEMYRIRILGQEVLDNIAAGVLAVGRDGRITYVNRDVSLLLGVKPEQISGMHYARAVPRKDIVEAIADTISGGRRLVRKIEIDERPIELMISPIREAGGGPLRGIVVILSDRSLQKKVEEMSKIEERFGALVELSTSLAHEIRNPLASIKGASQELLTAESFKEDDRKLLSLLEREVTRLDRILNSFLEYASPKPLELRICDLSKVLEDVAALLEARIKTESIRIERDIGEGIFCKGDSDALKQVFLNVGINAIESIRKGREQGLIRMVCRSGADGGVAVEIRDNGEGIKRDLVSRIFDPFFSTKATGTGMGLSVARKIIQTHGGRVSIESEIDKGATCKIWLPS
jgi:PAS domain S-box-containing protein